MPVSRSMAVYFKQGTVSNVALTLVTFGFPAAQVGFADRVLISVDTGALRVIWDTALTTPTTSKGMYVTNKNIPFVEITGRQNASLIQMIRDGGSDATVNITIESD